MKAASFDFDDTLSRGDVQDYARELISKGVRVYVTTSRVGDTGSLNKNWNKDLYKVTSSLGIKDVIFTGGSDKAKALKGKNVAFHLDDSEVELENFQKSSIAGVSLFDDWREKCNKLLGI